MALKKYRTPTQDQANLLVDTQLPTGMPIAIYYRQSTDAQVGNISTTIQTVDMVNYLKTLGWSDENIIMIDMDGGVSGTKKIDERPGMSMLYGLITDGKISAVACQDEDRLFRDVTQIQVNIFIEACKAHRVLVITPSVVYNFAHPQMGTFHARQFRFKSEMAAEYISSVIRGKLHAAKKSLHLNGKWSGSSMPVGFMVDMRKKLPDGSDNPSYRKYVPFEPYAEVVREYFNLFVQYSGNRYKIVKHIQNKGPYFPDPNTCLPPEGFKFVHRIKQYGGKWYTKSKATLNQMYTNAAYIGHWIANDHVVQWNNHPPIIDEKMFYHVFNSISSVTLTGGVNPNYTANAINSRPSKHSVRNEDTPILSGFIFATLDEAWKQVGTHWDNKNKHYVYVLNNNDGLNKSVWRKKASYFDAAVSTILLEKLQLTLDVDDWKTAIDASFEKLTDQKRLIESQLQHLETVMGNLIANLETLSNPQMIAAVEQRYTEASKERDRLQVELAAIMSNTIDTRQLIDLQASFKETLEMWDEMTSDQKREVMHTFLRRIEVTEIEADVLELAICWKDNSTNKLKLVRAAPRGTVWLPQHTELLVKLINSGASRLEIAKAFPNTKWNAIYRRYYYITGNRFPRESKNSIHKEESYNEYAKRIGLASTNVTSEACWPMATWCSLKPCS